MFHLNLTTRREITIVGVIFVLVAKNVEILNASFSNNEKNNNSIVSVTSIVVLTDVHLFICIANHYWIIISVMGVISIVVATSAQCTFVPNLIKPSLAKWFSPMQTREKMQCADKFFKNYYYY